MNADTHADAAKPTPKPKSLFAASVTVCYLTSVLVGLSMAYGSERIPRSSVIGHVFHKDAGPWANWDGQWYADIADNGYFFDRARHSSVAFFPAFPLLGRWLSLVSGFSSDAALAAIANLCLLGAMWLLAEHVRGDPALERDPAKRRDAVWVLLALGLFPTGFFFRMAYSESLFLLLVVLVLRGMSRRWPALVIAILIGAATGTRAAGIGLLPAFWLHLRRERQASHPKRQRLGALGRAGLLTALACWGLIAYMIFLESRFGSALAFAQTQEHWRTREEPDLGTVPLRIVRLLTLEPIRTLYDPQSPHWVGQHEPNPLLGLGWANPIYFLIAVIAVTCGAARRWITPVEAVAAAGLLLVPYATVGYEQYMRSMGRFSTAVAPMHIVIGMALARIPAVWASGALCAFAAFLALYSARFAAWQPLL